MNNGTDNKMVMDAMGHGSKPEDPWLTFGLTAIYSNICLHELPKQQIWQSQTGRVLESFSG